MKAQTLAAQFSKYKTHPVVDAALDLIGDIDTESEPEHVDDFIEYGAHCANREELPDERYARFVLHLMRLPAGMIGDFKPFTKDFKLFCTWRGKRYRVTFASRMGWIGLSSNLNATSGYDENAWVEDITEWSRCAV